MSNQPDSADPSSPDAGRVGPDTGDAVGIDLAAEVDGESSSPLGSVWAVGAALLLLLGAPALAFAGLLLDWPMRWLWFVIVTLYALMYLVMGVSGLINRPKAHVASGVVLCLAIIFASTAGIGAAFWFLPDDKAAAQKLAFEQSVCAAATPSTSGWDRAQAMVADRYQDWTWDQQDDELYRVVRTRCPGKEHMFLRAEFERRTSFGGGKSTSDDSSRDEYNATTNDLGDGIDVTDPDLVNATCDLLGNGATTDLIADLLQDAGGQSAGDAAAQAGALAGSC